MKIVIIGAGSASFGRGQIVDLLSAKDLCGRSVRLVLVDTDPTALDVMLQFAGRVKAQTGSDLVLEGTTDRAVALPALTT